MAPTQPPRGPLTKQQLQAQLQDQGVRVLRGIGRSDIPFGRLPSQKFWGRLMLPLTAIWIVGFLAMGSFSILSRMQFNTAVKDPVRVKRASMLPHKAAMQQIEDFTDSVTHIPDVCWSGQAGSEFQRSQCSDFWNNLLMDGVVASLPFLLVAVFLLWAFDALAKTYLVPRKQIVQGQALFLGTLTAPPTMRNDFYGWFFCLRSLVVQLPNKSQVRVYIPLSDSVPPAGGQVQVYGGKKSWRSVRFFGVYVPPSVQVVKGA